MSSRRALSYVAVWSTISMLLATGCTSNRHTGAAPTTAAPPAGWPASLNDFSMVWSAEPGIDLTTWPAAAIRAYTESYLLVSITGDDKYLYPGFKESVDPNKSADGPTGTQFLWPKTGQPPANPWVGTELAHILSITSSGREVTAVTCEYLFGSAQQGRFGGYIAHVALPPPYGGVAPMRITMTAPATPGPRQQAQQGPARAPSVDVFNGWRVTSHQGGYFARFGVGTEWPDATQDRDSCIAKAPPHPNLSRDVDYPRSDFPTLPPSPGWPAPSAAS